MTTNRQIALKASLGKLTLAKPSGIELVPFEIGHVARVATLPLYHRDPFDRLLAAQALERDVPWLPSVNEL